MSKCRESWFFKNFPSKGGGRGSQNLGTVPKLYLVINYEGFPYLFSFDFILLSVKLFPGRFLIFLNSASNTFGWYFQEIKKSVFNSSNLFSNILMQIRINIKATYIYFFTVKLQYNHKDIKYRNLQQLGPSASP